MGCSTRRRERGGAAVESRTGKVGILHLHADIEISGRIPQGARTDLPSGPIGATAAESARRTDQGVYCRAVRPAVDQAESRVALAASGVVVTSLTPALAVLGLNDGGIPLCRRQIDFQ